MTHLILFGSIGSMASDTAETFGWDLPHFIAQCISFAIVAGCLVKFAYKPILTVLEERRQRIADGLANADQIKKELARTEVMQREVLDKANVQANKLIEEARAAAARVQEQETQKAIAQAEQIVTKAREAAALERQRMLTDLKREVVTLVVQTTGAVAGKVLTADDQQRLAEETRRQLAA
jgi:F-type H+-transporting ATPase subunit b